MGSDVPHVIQRVPFGDPTWWQCREFGERRVSLNEVNHADNDYRTRPVWIVDSVAYKPPPLVGVDDSTSRLRTVEHGSLDDRAKAGREPCVLEREGQLAEDLVAHTAIFSESRARGLTGSAVRMAGLAAGQPGG